MIDFYEIMGVRPEATEDEIKRSFRKLAVTYHPDKNNSADAEDKFKEINQAYEVLGDPQRRAQYDVLLADQKEIITHAKSYHRDPAYRRNRAYQSNSVETQSTHQLMAEFLPKFRWACWVSLFVCFVVALDFFLPFHYLQDDIMEINRMYRTGRGGGMIYDHDELITRSGISIKLFNEELVHFKNVRQIKLEKSPLFGKIVTASTPNEDYKVKIAPIYSHLLFVPILLFITSLLGVVVRKSVEFPFNLSIVSFLMLILVVFILFK